MDTKPKMHFFFDDEGNPFEPTQNDHNISAHALEEVCESYESDPNKMEDSSGEMELLGYEAHSSSVEDCSEVVNDNKKQKRKKKRKCRLPQEMMENKKLLKYFLRRYQLFSLFDKGIKLDTGNL